MMFPAPDPDRCVAYRGPATGAWYVITLRRDSFAMFPHMSDKWALELAATHARSKGWVK